MSLQLIGEMNNQLACRQLKTVFEGSNEQACWSDGVFVFVNAVAVQLVVVVFFASRLGCITYLNKIMANRVQINCSDPGINWQILNGRSSIRRGLVNNWGSVNYYELISENSLLMWHDVILWACKFFMLTSNININTHHNRGIESEQLLNNSFEPLFKL